MVECPQGCGEVYCGQECQAADWKDNHSEHQTAKSADVLTSPSLYPPLSLSSFRSHVRGAIG